MFIAGALSFLVLGLVEFLLIRLQLIVPENTLIEPVTFNRLLSVMSAERRRPLRGPARDRALHLRRPAPDRRPVDRLPAARPTSPSGCT